MGFVVVNGGQCIVVSDGNGWTLMLNSGHGWDLFSG